MDTEASLDNAALLEHLAGWVLGVRDKTKAWLSFAAFGVLVTVVAAYARVNLVWVAAGVVASSFVFEWLMRKKTVKEWQRYEFARQHFRALLECRKTLQSMSKDERAEVKPEVAKWFLDTFMPGGIEHHVLWEYAHEGVMYPATRRLKLESMGLRRDTNFPNYKEVEYAWDRYQEINPDREWIRKLRERGGYVEPLEKWRAAVEENQRRWNTKPPDGAKENV